MLATITISGRPTKDPAMQKKGDSQYIILNIAQNQGFGDEEHPVFFNCYFGSYLAERLVKAKVKKGTCLDITGRFDSKEFTRKDGTSDRSLDIKVMDWEFSISNRNEAAGQNAAPPQNMPSAQYGAPAQNGAMPQNMQARGNQMPKQNAGSAQGYGQAGYQSLPANMALAQNYAMAGQNYGAIPQGYPMQDGFSNVPEVYASQLPFQTA